MIAAALCVTTAWPFAAAARSNRVGQIPNGGSYTCDSCHGKVSLLEADLTPFGVDVNNTLSGDNVVWSALWNLDSDGDGFSNGLELGDPGGTWRRGDPNPNQPVANPGVPNQGICGNLSAEPDEDCDSADLRGETCESLGFGLGFLKCHPLCRWDTSECGPCGDGFLNPNYEDCDRDAFLPQLTCAEYGFLRGELSCDVDCKVDTSTCTDEAPAVCGDGVISTGEFCDGDNLGAVDCLRIAYAGGTLLCTDDCKWNASNCVFDDGRRVGDEERAAADESSGTADAGTGTDAGVVNTDTGSNGSDGAQTVRGTGSASGCAIVPTARASPAYLVLIFGLWGVRQRRRKL